MSIDRQQIVYALERQARALGAQADALARMHDYSAEMPSQDADCLLEAVRLLQAAPATVWRAATSPPDGQPGNWTRKVIAVTDFGQVLGISYFHPEVVGVVGVGVGCWQNARAFDSKVMCWADFPTADSFKIEAVRTLQPDPSDVMRELLELTTKAGRRCAHDLDHAADWIESQEHRETFRNRARMWQGIFYPDKGPKDYRTELHREIVTLEGKNDTLIGLLREVRKFYLHKDALPNGLLPRIDEAIDGAMPF